MDSIYTGDPNIDVWIFVSLVAVIVGVVALFVQRSQEKATNTKFEEDKARFWKEVEEGKEPDFVPYKITHDGRRYTDPDCLMHRKTVREHFKNMDKIVKRDKERRKNEEL